MRVLGVIFIIISENVFAINFQIKVLIIDQCFMGRQAGQQWAALRVVVILNYYYLDFTSQNSLQVLSPRQIRGKLNYGPFPGAQFLDLCAMASKASTNSIENCFGLRLFWCSTTPPDIASYDMRDNLDSASDKRPFSIKKKLFTG